MGKKCNAYVLGTNFCKVIYLKKLFFVKLLAKMNKVYYHVSEFSDYVAIILLKLIYLTVT